MYANCMIFFPLFCLCSVCLTLFEIQTTERNVKFTKRPNKTVQLDKPVPVIGQYKPSNVNSDGLCVTSNNYLHHVLQQSFCFVHCPTRLKPSYSF